MEKNLWERVAKILKHLEDLAANEQQIVINGVVSYINTCAEKVKMEQNKAAEQDKPEVPADSELPKKEGTLANLDGVDGVVPNPDGSNSVLENPIA